MREQTHLLHLPLVTLVRSGHIICQGLRAGEVVVAAGRRDDVALAGDLAGEAGDGAGDLVNLAEEQDAGEAAGSGLSAYGAWNSVVGNARSGICVSR